MIIDGKFFSNQIKCELKDEIQQLKKKGLVPGLAVIMVGDDPASKIYVNNKKKTCDELGIYSQVHCLPESISQDELLEIISRLNKDKKIHGILTQLPLPKHINEFTVSQAILPEKDVDCFNQINIGRLFLGKSKFLPCTPAGIIELLKRSNVKIEGKSCVIVGRSNIVGKPLSLMLLQENATVTVCHSKTLGLEDFCKKADILISAVGKPKFINENMVKKGAVVIDVGINRMENGKICGDVDFEKVSLIAEYITPVPGGVGPMTIAMLMRNVVSSIDIV